MNPIKQCIEESVKEFESTTWCRCDICRDSRNSLFLSSQEKLVRVIVEEIINKKFSVDLKYYLPLVKKWDGKTYDTAFDDGYKMCKENILSTLQEAIKK